MALILNIETATQICSVALAKDRNVISFAETNTANSHASQITLLIDRIMNDSNISFKSLDAIAVSEGPGSFTGLRIGVSTAKGLCYALNKPMIAVSTLDALARSVMSNHYKVRLKEEKDWMDNYFICPLIDARRMEVYTALYDSSGKRIVNPQAIIVDENFLSGYLNEQNIIFVGNAVNKCKGVLMNRKTILDSTLECSATNMVDISEQKFQERKFENTAYFEPFYLKSFQSK